MKNRCFALALAVSLVSSTTKPSSYAPSEQTICYAGACAVLGATLYKYGIPAFNSWMEQKIVDQASDDLALSLTLNSIIDKWPEPKRMQAFCRKAQLITLRKKVLEQLEKHPELKTKLAFTKRLFDIVDYLRFPAKNNSDPEAQHVAIWIKETETGKKLIASNPCEGKSQAQMSPTGYYFNPFIEDKIKRYIFNPVVVDRTFQSILLSSAPNTPANSAEKAALAKRRQLIIDKAVTIIKKNYNISDPSSLAEGVATLLIDLLLKAYELDFEKTLREKMATIVLRSLSLNQAVLFIPLYEESK